VATMGTVQLENLPFEFLKKTVEQLSTSDTLRARQVKNNYMNPMRT